MMIAAKERGGATRAVGAVAADMGYLAQGSHGFTVSLFRRERLLASWDSSPERWNSLRCSVIGTAIKSPGKRLVVRR